MFPQGAQSLILRSVKITFKECIPVLRHSVGILLVGVSVFVASYWLVPAEVGLECVRYLTKPLFYLLLLSVAGLLAGLFCPPRKCWYLLVLATVGTLVLVVQQSYSYRVLSDEYVICAQAKSLHEYGTSDYPVRTFPAYGELKRQEALVDKRPPAFSVLLALVHDLTGYRPVNVFILNTAIGFTFLLLLLHAARFAADRKWEWYESGAWVLVLACSLPLLSLSMTGAGLDLLNVFLIFSSAWLAWKVLSEDSPRWVFAWLGVSWLLFNCRYESILFVLSIGAVLLVKVFQTKRLPVVGALYTMPFLLAPYVLRHRVFDLSPEISWQAGQGKPFDFSYFPGNLGHAVDYLFVPHLQGSGSLLLAWLGLISLLVLGVRFIRSRSFRRMPSVADVVFFAYGGVILINLFLLMCYYWGRLDELEVSRLALPVFFLFGVSIYRVALRISSSRPKLVRCFLVCGLVYVFVYAVPSKSETLALKGNYHAEIDSWALGQVRGRGEPNPMVISTGPLFWYLHDVSSMPPDALEFKLRGFEFHRRCHSMNAYLLQKIKVDPITGDETILDGENLSRIYATSVISEMSYKPYHIARLSKIEEMKESFSKQMNYPTADIDFYRKHPVEYWFFQIP